MALPLAPTVIKCSMFQTLNGQPIMNRFHVKVGATNPSQAECAAVAAMAEAWWQGSVKPLVGSELELREIHCQSLAEVNGPQATFSAGLPEPGTLVSQCLPGNVAFCVSLRSGLSGRSARGRWYWAGLVEAQVAGNVVDAGAVAAIVSAMDGLLTAVTGIGADPIIVSYYTNGALRPGGPVYFIITDALAVDSVVDSQRGRLR
jgi:hypothetical protein